MVVINADTTSVSIPFFRPFIFRNRYLIFYDNRPRIGWVVAVVDHTNNRNNIVTFMPHCAKHST